MMPPRKKLLRALNDITLGYSESFVFNKRFYVKHPTALEYNHYDIYYDDEYQNLLDQGVPSEKERLDTLDETGEWTRDQENKLNALKLQVERLDNTISKLIYEKQKKEVLDQKKKVEKELEEMREARFSVLGLTAERLASQRKNDYLVVNLSYKDKDCSIPLLSEEEAEELSNQELFLLSMAFQSSHEMFSIENLKWIAVSDSFQFLVNLNDSINGFFNKKKTIDITYLQGTLFRLGQYFKTLLSEHRDIPDNVRNNPIEIEEFIKTKSSLDEFHSKTGKDRTDSAVSYVGASKEDLKKLAEDETIVDLSQEIKKKGGLRKEDFIKMLN